MVCIKRFLLMMQFLTTIPLPVNLKVDNEDFGKGLVFAPVTGLIIGGLLALFDFFTGRVFERLVQAVIIFIVYILLTGGLHLDGLGDTFDGLFSNRPKDRILEIMRDSRVGTNAVLAIVSVILLDVSLLAAINEEWMIRALLLMPAAGRIGSLIGAGVSTYARSGEGLGKSFIDYCGIKEIIIGLLIYFLIFWAISGKQGLILGIFPPVTAFLVVKFFSKKIDGATGDILGAVCELNQALFLVSVYVAQHL